VFFAHALVPPEHGPIGIGQRSECATVLPMTGVAPFGQLIDDVKQRRGAGYVDFEAQRSDLDRFIGGLRGGANRQQERKATGE
jgi:hypothetical protein